MVGLRNVSVGVVLFGLLFTAPSFAGSEVVTIDSRPNVKLKVLVIEPEKPSSILVLYAGGDGTLSLSSTFSIPNMGSYQDNFLVRVREKFVEKGFIVALPDIPSDIQEATGLYRISEDQAKDIHSLTSYLKNRYNLPIWIIGTSRSSFTVATAGIYEGDRIKGLIFSSSITKVSSKSKMYSSHPNGVVNLKLSEIKVPVLIAAHKEDGCELTPSEGAELIKKGLISSPKIEVKYYSGGSPPTSKPCGALSQHGFLGIEDQVVADMVAFIRAN